MAEFVRRLEGFPQLDAVPTDPLLRDLGHDGLKSNPVPLPWADYVKMKSILHYVLGERAFEVLFREAGPGAYVNRYAFHLAGTIVMHYVGRYSDRSDLQTTLIAQIACMRSNMAAGGQRAAVMTQVERMLVQCQLPADYLKYVQQKISEAKVIETPWWSMINY